MSYQNTSLVSRYLCSVKLTAVLIIPTVIAFTNQASNAQQPIHTSLVATLSAEVKQAEGYKPPRRGVPSRREGGGTR